MAEAPRISANVLQAIVDVHGDVGRAWLARLPTMLEALRDRWQLEFGPPFVRAAYAYVISVKLPDGTPAVLKATVPGRELDLEVAALVAFAGRGVVRLFDADTAVGTILLERLEPGIPLSEVRDGVAATRAAIAVMRESRTPAPSFPVFPTTAQWASGLARLRQRFGGGTGPFSAALVEAAERVFDELHASAAESALLHGDIHFGNILAARRREWLAVDPKGILGEPAYEAGALLRNPLPDLPRKPNVSRILDDRLDLLANELQLDRGRVAAYAFAQAVLASWWQFEDHGAGWEPWMHCAEMLRELSE